ncbi:hypothetical protein EWM64_g6775 [Hericium alpestre]|uniref:Uncharacterized protein n=1 Tax=Hericium alpestre TaxID=135208 RepID=A0A4Y9ZR42_9AGAM|nr:hypothetical protein EWM64_g6775 [Hericium alpestre]
MSNDDTYELLFRDPEYIVLKSSHCFEKLCNLLDYGAAHFPLESYSYGASSWMLTLYSAVCQPADPSGSLGAHPQLLFEDVDPFKHSFKAHKRRSPDLGAVISHLQEARRDSVLYKEPSLLFWWEIKALKRNTPWLSEPADVRVAMTLHLPQVIEQAQFAMKHYVQQQVFYGFLIIGGSFSLWKFTRPSNSANYGQPAVSASGKRQRIPSHDSFDSGVKLTQETIHYCELIVDRNRKNFSPQFLYAMALVKGEHDIIQQPSFFDPLPGDYSADPFSLADAEADVQKAKEIAKQAAAEEALSSNDEDAKPPRRGGKRRRIKYDDRSFQRAGVRSMRDTSPCQTRSRSNSSLSAEPGFSIRPTDETDDDDDDDDADNNDRNDDDDDDMGVGQIFPVFSDDEDEAETSSNGISPYDILRGSEYNSEFGLGMQDSLLYTTSDASSSGASQYDGPFDSEYASDEELDEESEDASPNPPPPVLPPGSS